MLRRLLPFLWAAVVFAQMPLAPKDQALFSRLEKIEMEALWAALNGEGYTSQFIHELNPLHTNRRMIGRARTVRYLPNRPDLRERLYAKSPQLNYVSAEQAEPGDILVFDAGGDTRSAVTGVMTTRRFVYRGGRGMVADGAFRDVPGMRELPIQVYLRRGQASSVSPNLLSADYQVPVRVANTTVVPGDILVGDEHGILVIPAAMIEKVAAKAEETSEKEAFMEKLLTGGAPIPEVYPRLSEANQKKFDAAKKKK